MLPRGSRRRGSALRPLNGLSVGSRPCDSRVIVLQLASGLAGARGAEAAHEAYVSLCMSHWSGEGGQKTSVGRGAKPAEYEIEYDNIKTA